MTQEIQRGQAGAALAIFTQISSRHLEQTSRNSLAVIRKGVLMPTRKHKLKQKS